MTMGWLYSFYLLFGSVSVLGCLGIYKYVSFDETGQVEDTNWINLKLNLHSCSFILRRQRRLLGSSILLVFNLPRYLGWMIQAMEPWTRRGPADGDTYLCLS